MRALEEALQKRAPVDTLGMNECTCHLEMITLSVGDVFGFLPITSP
jgi:hypothetical protein